MIDQLAFDAPTNEDDGYGGTKVGWEEQFKRRCTIIYQSGGEAVQAARLSGRPVFKVKMRQNEDARRITTDWQVRDVRRGDDYNITEVDAITSRQWIWLVVEGRVS